LQFGILHQGSILKNEEHKRIDGVSGVVCLVIWFAEKKRAPGCDNIDEIVQWR
jgi:hypothetical protein